MPLSKFSKRNGPLLSARSKYKHLFDLPLITILGGTVLRDKRLQGRFAFVMYRRWGDLRLLIDRRMKQERSTLGPFPIDEAIHLMLSIAEDMDTLHNKHDILHRDLKASNVLVWGEFKEDMSLIATPNRVTRIGSLVADFECSVGVLGTGFWRAPEILEQLKDRVPSSKVQFTRPSDVYSYGMTCYEIVTGCIPYDGRGGKDTISQILQGQRPELPHELPEFVRNIIVGCWHSDPLDRPTFSAICVALKVKKVPNPVSVVIDNKFESGASIVEVEKWNNPQALTLLEVMQKLMDMDLSVLKASDSSSTTMITQYFEVIDCEGRKIENDKSIANITKALGLAVKREHISESLGTFFNRNTLVQMHVVEVIAEWSAGFLGVLSRLLVAMNFQVHPSGCCTREGRVECVIYVEGARMGTLLWEIQHNMEYFPISPGRFRIIVHRVLAEEFFHLNRRLQNLKSMDLTLPRRSSNIRIHQRKESAEGFRYTEVVVCFENRWRLHDVSCALALRGYKICRASIEYPDPYDFLEGGAGVGANKSEDINLRGLKYEFKNPRIYIEDESSNLRIFGEESSNPDRKYRYIIRRILDIATKRGCREGNGQLIISGPSERLRDDLMDCFHIHELVVTGGQLYRGGWEYSTGHSVRSGDLVFFVTG